MRKGEELRMLESLTRTLSEHLADLERATALFRVLVRDLEVETNDFGRVSVEHSLAVLRASERMLLNTPLPSPTDIRAATARLGRIAARLEKNHAAGLQSSSEPWE